MIGRVFPGEKVLSIEGRRLGIVIDTAVGAVKVRLEDDELWLPVSAVWTIGPDGLTLICDELGVRRYDLAFAG